MSPENVGPNVRRLRRAAGMDQDQLSARLGTSKAWVSMLENGRTLPSIHRVVELAGIFSVTTDALLEDSHG